MLCYIRWDEAKKGRIMDSRVKGTAAIVQAIAQLKSPPRTLICSSGVGYYGYQGGSQVRHLNSQRPPTVAQRLFPFFAVLLQ
jgi:NAD dependent epimerase/dehydratase family enzyme